MTSSLPTTPLPTLPSPAGSNPSCPKNKSPSLRWTSSSITSPLTTPPSPSPKPTLSTASSTKAPARTGSPTASVLHWSSSSRMAETPGSSSVTVSPTPARRTPSWAPMSSLGFYSRSSGNLSSSSLMRHSRLLHASSTRMSSCRSRTRDKNSNPKSSRAPSRLTISIAIKSTKAIWGHCSQTTCKTARVLQLPTTVPVPDLTPSSRSQPTNSRSESSTWPVVKESAKAPPKQTLTWRKQFSSTEVSWLWRNVSGFWNNAQLWSKRLSCLTGNPS